jgi:hypothetical protein
LNLESRRPKRLRPPRGSDDGSQTIRKIRFQGQPLAEIDLACCQPSLLALLMTALTRQKGGENVTSYNALPADLLLPPALSVAACWCCGCGYADSLSAYRDVCSSGLLYEVLSDRLQQFGKNLSRQQIKKRFLVDVLAKRLFKNGREYPSSVEAAFRDEFPGVWKFARAVNQNGQDHCRLIRMLQRLESWLVIDLVCERFMDRHPNDFIITIHDAVFVRPEAVERVKETFDAVFHDLDFRMALKVA